MLNKKFLVKIMNNEDYRRQFLLYHQHIVKNPTLKILDYAKYVVDYQILNRNNDFANDRKSYYGFSPIAPICYVSNDGDVVVKMFEMNSINHFLMRKNGNAAVDVATCIIIQLYIECKKLISSFSVEMIDAALTNAEKEYKAKDEEKNT